MRKKYQLHTVNPENGDCLRACICTLLGLPIKKVPNFRVMGPEPVSALRDWLNKHYELDTVTVYVGKNDPILVGAKPGTRLIAAYGSPNISGGFHAVIVEVDQTGQGLKLFHDPRRHGNTIKHINKPIQLLLLVPTNWRYDNMMFPLEYTRGRLL